MALNRSILDTATAVLLGVVAVFLLAATLLVTTTVAGAQSQPSKLHINADHGLVADDAYQTFDEDGVVSTDLQRADMTVTIAEDHEDVGVSGFQTDAGSLYLRFEYREEIAREIRFYVPAAYASPRVNRDPTLVTGDVPVSLDPAEDRSYTAVTLTVTEPTDVVVKMSKVRGKVSTGRAWVRSQVENGTNIDLPRLAAKGEWAYVSDDLDGANATARLPEGDHQVQYASPVAEDAWVTVPDCDSQVEPVCQFNRDGATYVLAVNNDSPEVRYREQSQGGIVSNVSAAVSDLRAIPGRIAQFVGSLFGTVSVLPAGRVADMAPGPAPSLEVVTHA